MASMLPPSPHPARDRAASSGGADYGKRGPVMTLAAAASAPLVLTLAPQQMVALGVGTALVVALVKMTFADGELDSAEAEKAEQQARKNLIFTSSGNRAVRISLGSVYLYAAFTCALHRLDSTVLARLLDLDATAIGLVSCVWVGCLVDGYFGGLWITSGANGE